MYPIEESGIGASHLQHFLECSTQSHNIKRMLLVNTKEYPKYALRSTFYKQCSRGNLKTTNPVPVLIVRTVDEVSYQLGGLLRLLIPAHLVCRWELDRIFRNLV